jgi:3-hydroxy-D-aspartate aldolase
MDIEYLEQGFGCAHWPFLSCATVQGTVISANWADHVVTDAGDKRFTSKYGCPPRIVSGASRSAHYRTLSDEHGRIDVPPGCPLPKVGQRVECMVPHCDPTVNLFDEYHVMRGRMLEAIWPIDARGR